MFQNRFENMTDKDYMDHAEALLKAVEASCDRLNTILDEDWDIDNQRVGQMIHIRFGAKHGEVVINLQKPLHEVWLATQAGGFHYRFDGVTWRDTKQDTAFFDDLSTHCSAQTGVSLVFTALEV